MIFKGIVLKGSLVKLEKYEEDILVSQCGIDSEKAIEVWGVSSPLREEYELWVSQGNCPEYIFTDYIEEIAESEPTPPEE